MNSVNPFISDGLCSNYKKCHVQNKNMGCINVTEMVHIGRSIFITLEELGEPSEKLVLKNQQISF